MIREFPWVPWESHGNGKHWLNSWKCKREWEWWTENWREMGIAVWKKFQLVADGVTRGGPLPSQAPLPSDATAILWAVWATNPAKRRRNICSRDACDSYIWGSPAFIFIVTNGQLVKHFTRICVQTRAQKVRRVTINLFYMYLFIIMNYN